MRIQELIEQMKTEQEKIRATMGGLHQDENRLTKERLMLLDSQIEQYELRSKALLEQSNLGRRFKDRSFDNFNVELQPKAYEIAYEYATGFSDDTDQGLFFMGNPGTGKTHLAAAITNYIVLDLGIPVKFGNFIDILTDIKKGFNTDEDIALQLKQIPLLVIDDLGKERSTEWSESILYEVINGRYEDYMPTIITTNLTPKQVESRFGEAVLSRLSEMCTGVVMNGSDFRRNGGKK